MRIFMGRLIYTDEKYIHSGDWERWHTTALYYLNEMKTRPISSYKDTSGDRVSKYNSSVTSITVYGMRNLGTQGLLNREWATCDYLNEFMEISSKKAKSIEKPYDFVCWNKGVTENTGFANISVDLLVPDEQILKDFIKLIKDVRKVLNCYSKKKNFTQTDMLKWHDIRLLPFIDLTIISLIEGKKINYSQMAELIYPDKNQRDLNLELAESIRRTTKPKAIELLQRKTILIMEAQTAAQNQ